MNPRALAALLRLIAACLAAEDPLAELYKAADAAEGRNHDHPPHR